jgi:hypothetical protein
MSATVRKMVPICLFWCLWREINNKSFEDLESTLEEILSSFYLSLYFWTTAYVHPWSFTFADFLARFSVSLYTPSVIREALRFFNEIGFLLIKK